MTGSGTTGAGPVQGFLVPFAGRPTAEAPTAGRRAADGLAMSGGGWPATGRAVSSEISELATAVVTGRGRALPDSVSQQDLWDGFFAARLGGLRFARRTFFGAGISRRHPAVNPLVEDVSQWSTAERMARFQREARPLAEAAAREAVETAGLDPGSLGLVAVVSCTGYATPGVAIHLADVLRCDPGVQRLDIGHMGCHAGLVALGTVRDFVVARAAPALVVAVELSSLHLQPGVANGLLHRSGPSWSDAQASPARRETLDLEQVVVHSLFSDAAVAAVVEPRRGSGGCTGYAVVDVVARTDTRAQGEMTWTVTDHGFRMTLSRRAPLTLAAEVALLVETLLARNGVERTAVRHWAVHPGGPRVLEVIGERLGLDPGELAASERVLREHGNCSSATVFLVLDEVLATACAGDYVVALAFGPGLSLYGALLRVT